MLNKLIAPFAGLLLILAMSSCSGDDSKTTRASSEPASSQTEEVAPVETDKPSSDEEFVSQLQNAIPETKQGNEADYIRLAKEFCSFLDDGYTPQGVINSWIANGGDGESVSTMLKIAAPIYCPQHTNTVEVNLP